MNLQEIKTAIAEGKNVKWSNSAYDVIKDKNDQYLIKHSGGHCIGLTWTDETTLNGKEEDFFIEPHPSHKAFISAFYEALMKLWEGHINNGGKIDYSEKAYSYISDTLDNLQVGYFKETPDGDYQNQLKNNGFTQTTQEAFDDILARFTNTAIEFKEG